MGRGPQERWWLQALMSCTRSSKQAVPLPPKARACSSKADAFLLSCHAHCPLTFHPLATFSKLRPTVSPVALPPRAVLEKSTFRSCLVVQGVFGQPRGFEVPGQMAPVDSLAETAQQGGGGGARVWRTGCSNAGRWRCPGVQGTRSDSASAAAPMQLEHDTRQPRTWDDDGGHLLHHNLVLLVYGSGGCNRR